MTDYRNLTPPKPETPQFGMSPDHGPELCRRTFEPRRAEAGWWFTTPTPAPVNRTVAGELARHARTGIAEPGGAEVRWCDPRRDGPPLKVVVCPKSRRHLTAVLYDWRVDNLEVTSVFVRHYRVVPTLLAASAITNTELADKVRRFWCSPSQHLGHSERLEMPTWVEDALIERDGRGCRNPHCDEHRRQRGPRQIDHVIPVVHSGDDQLANLQLLCPTCNQRKSTSYWRAFLEREAKRTAA